MPYISHMCPQQHNLPVPIVVILCHVVVTRMEDTDGVQQHGSAQTDRGLHRTDVTLHMAAIWEVT